MDQPQFDVDEPKFYQYSVNWMFGGTWQAYKSVYGGDLRKIGEPQASAAEALELCLLEARGESF